MNKVIKVNNFIYLPLEDVLSIVQILYAQPKNEEANSIIQLNRKMKEFIYKKFKEKIKENSVEIKVHIQKTLSDTAVYFKFTTINEESSYICSSNIFKEKKNVTIHFDNEVKQYEIYIFEELYNLLFKKNKIINPFYINNGKFFSIINDKDLFYFCLSKQTEILNFKYFLNQLDIPNIEKFNNSILDEDHLFFNEKLSLNYLYYNQILKTKPDFEIIDMSENITRFYQINQYSKNNFGIVKGNRKIGKTLSLILFVKRRGLSFYLDMNIFKEKDIMIKLKYLINELIHLFHEHYDDYIKFIYGFIDAIIKDNIFFKNKNQQIYFILEFIINSFKNGKIKSKTNSPNTNKGVIEPKLKEITPFDKIFEKLKKNELNTSSQDIDEGTFQFNEKLYIILDNFYDPENLDQYKSLFNSSSSSTLIICNNCIKDSNIDPEHKIYFNNEQIDKKIIEKMFNNQPIFNYLIEKYYSYQIYPIMMLKNYGLKGVKMINEEMKDIICDYYDHHNVLEKIRKIPNDFFDNVKIDLIEKEKLEYLPLNIITYEVYDKDNKKYKINFLFPKIKSILNDLYNSALIIEKNNVLDGNLFELGSKIFIKSIIENEEDNNIIEEININEIYYLNDEEILKIKYLLFDIGFNLLFLNQIKSNAKKYDFSIIGKVNNIKTINMYNNSNDNSLILINFQATKNKSSNDIITPFELLNNNIDICRQFNKQNLNLIDSYLIFIIGNKCLSISTLKLYNYQYITLNLNNNDYNKIWNAFDDKNNEINTTFIFSSNIKYIFENLKNCDLFYNNEIDYLYKDNDNLSEEDKKIINSIKNKLVRKYKENELEEINELIYLNQCRICLIKTFLNLYFIIETQNNICYIYINDKLKTICYGIPFKSYHIIFNKYYGRKFSKPKFTTVQQKKIK